MKRNWFVFCGALSLALLGVVSIGRADLVGLWRFDNPGNLGQDGAFNGNDLIVQGGVSFTASGKYGGAADFNGTDGALGPSGAFPNDVPIGDSSYTIAAWFLPDQTGDRGIVGWGNYGTGSQVNALRTFGTNGFRHYWWGADLDASDAQVAGPPHNANLLDGNWHHIAAVYDAGTSTRTLYLNGQLLVQDNPAAHDATAQNFLVGRTYNNEFWDGRLDDVAIYNEAMDVAGIQSIMSGAAFVPEPSSIALALVGLALAAGCLWRRRRRTSLRIESL